MFYRSAKWILICLGLIVVCQPRQSYAQELDFGLTFGAYGGQTAYTDNQAKLLTRVFLRHEWTERSFGEFNLGLGSVAGNEYRTRLIPFEYRYVYQLPSMGSELLGKLNPELFAGIGALYYQPLEVARPDDPLTVEVGPSVGVSNYWKYQDGIKPVIPIGAAIDIPLDQTTALQVGVQYNQSFSRSVTVTNDRFMQGYWGITVGIHFLKPDPPKPKPVVLSYNPPAPPESVIRPVMPSTTSLLEMARYEIESDTVFFDYFKAQIKSEQRDKVDRIANLMGAYPQIDLTLEGHTDSRGFQWFNLPLSKERAWSISKYMMRQGVGTERLTHTGYGEARPNYDNDTEEGRSKNRRVTFVTAIDMSPMTDEQDQRLADVAYDSTLFDSPITIAFDSQAETFDENFVSVFDQIAVNMMKDRAMRIKISGYPSSIGKERSRIFWANRRAEVVRLELMKRGIGYDRIETTFIDLDELDEINTFDKAVIQQKD